MALAGAVWTHLHRRDSFTPSVFALTCLTADDPPELVFTFYLNIYDILNLIGHYLKIVVLPSFTGCAQTECARSSCSS